MYTSSEADNCEVAEDEPWYCEMHPTPSLASCEVPDEEEAADAVESKTCWEIGEQEATRRGAAAEGWHAAERERAERHAEQLAQLADAVAVQSGLHVRARPGLAGAGRWPSVVPVAGQPAGGQPAAGSCRWLRVLFTWQ